MKKSSMNVQGKSGDLPNAPEPMTIGKIHSSLEHAISLLETEKAKMFDFAGRWIGTPGNDGEFRLDCLASIERAISILNAEKIKDIALAMKKFLKEIKNETLFSHQKRSD